MKDFLRLGLIQPVIDPAISWGKKPPFYLNVDTLIAQRVWEEIRIGLIEMLRVEIKPNIILIPELHLPVSKINIIRKLSKKHGVMIISGIDFQCHPVHNTKIRNRGIICIPDELGFLNKATRLTSMQFGKTYFTYMERDMFSEGIAGLGKCTEDPEQNMYIFQSSEIGNFGIVICSDIFDIERMMFFQGKIHHLFIISLNMDLNTYFAMTESLTRLLYCNVVVCNTGYFGGSIAVSPYSDQNNRTIYKYIGQKMFNTQIIDIPLKSLDDAQKFPFNTKNKGTIAFKAWPPGYPVKA